MNLSDKDSMDRAVEGADYMVHLTTPLTGDVIKQAVEGTETALKACQKYGVKRIVMCSNVVAC